WASSIAVYASGILLGLAALAVWAVRVLDRSEQQTAEANKDLRDRELRLTAAQTLGGVGSWKWDVAEATLDASGQVSAILGLDGPVPEGDNFSAYAHPDDKEEVEAALERSVESGEPYEVVHRIVRPDGSVRWIEARGDVQATDEGCPTAIFGTVADVTERIEGEQSMQDALKFARRIADSSPDVIYIDDLEKHKRIYTNREIGEVLGYSSEQIEEHGERLLWDAVHEDDKERLVDHLRSLRTAQDDDVHVVEFRVKRADGAWASIRRRDTVFQRAGSRPTQILGVAEDVTAEREAARLLRESEERYERVAKHSPGVVFQLRLAADGTASFPYLSPGTERLLGFASERIAREPLMIFKLVPDEDRFRYLRELVRSSRTLQNFEWTGRFRLAEDDERWIQVSARPSRSADGSMLWDGLIRDVTEVRTAQQALAESRASYTEYVRSVERDITERKQIEDALRKSEQRFRMMADSSPIGLGLRDGSGDYVYVNSAFQEITSLSLEEVQRGGLQQGLHTEDRDRVLASLKKFYEDVREGSGRKVLTFETRWIRKDEQEIWLLVNSAPVVDDEEDVSFVTTIQDITARRTMDVKSQAKPMPASAVRPGGPALNGKARILLIEDNEASIRMMEQLFDRETEYEMTVAMTSGIGLELAKKNVPDAIILDANLPDAGGTSVIDAIKDDEDLCGVPVFMLSADASAEQIERFKRAGAEACLTKPVDVGELLAVLEGARVGHR
ncbi:MAG: PAS domain S-box protein, partial [Armatimonadetes bacterium]|nr:PAS domain S-box protein [Armatimonadota bacterium]